MFLVEREQNDAQRSVKVQMEVKLPLLANHANQGLVCALLYTGHRHALGIKVWLFFLFITPLTITSENVTCSNSMERGRCC